VVKLQNALFLYQRLKATIAPPTAQDFAAELAEFQANLPAGLAAFRAQQEGKPHDAAAFRAIASQFSKFSNMAEYAYPLVVPPLTSHRGARRLGERRHKPHADPARGGSQPGRGGLREDVFCLPTGQGV
jgi:hypothetical protein